MKKPEKVDYELASALSDLWDSGGICKDSVRMISEFRESIIVACAEKGESAFGKVVSRGDIYSTIMELIK
jgi:hypothetical protein